MTCAEVARIFEAEVERRIARRSRGRVPMRHVQMKRIAHRLHQHGGEVRFAEDLRDALAGLSSLDLLFLEVAMNDWWGWPT